MCGLMPTLLAKASPDVMQHAPVAESNAAFPLVIFSHGIGGNRLAYSAIICSLVCQVGVTYHAIHLLHALCSPHHTVCCTYTQHPGHGVASKAN